MNITELIWLDTVMEKIESKHHCLPTDVEEVFAKKPKVKKMHRGHFYDKRNDTCNHETLFKFVDRYKYSDAKTETTSDRCDLGGVI